MKIRWFLRAPLVLVLFALAVLAVGLIVMLLWNALIPDLFNGPVLTYWQAVGLLLLSKILFHGFGRGGHPHRRRDEHWKRRFARAMRSMTPEQREYCRMCRRFEQQWGFDGDETHTAATDK